MRNRLLFALFFITINIFAQTDSISKRKITIKYAPLTILDVNLNTLQFGLEYYLNDNYSLQLEYGQKIPFPEDSYFRRSFVGGNGYRIKTELHYNFPQNQRLNRYIGFETFYWRNNYDGRDVFRNTQTQYLEDFYYKVNKRSLGLGLKYGVAFTFFKKIDLEFFGGIGLKYLFIKNTDRNIDNRPNYVYIEPRRDELFADPSFSPDLEKYSGLRFDVPLGIRIGYKIY